MIYDTIEKFHVNDSKVNLTAKFFEESSFEKYNTLFLIIQNIESIKNPGLNSCENLVVKITAKRIVWDNWKLTEDVEQAKLMRISSQDPVAASQVGAALPGSARAAGHRGHVRGPGGCYAT